MTDPLADLSAAGVAVWLDDLSRSRLQTGNLADLYAAYRLDGDAITAGVAELLLTPS